MDKVLIVAPIANGLQTQLSEVEASISAFYHPELLLGNVTKERLQLGLTKDVAGFWYIGHAQVTDGLQLSDGPLSVRLLGSYLRFAQIEWSYLNTCYSEQFIVQLQSAYPHDIMANVGEIDDNIAGQNGMMLAQALSQTGDIRKAYRWVANSGNSALRYFPSPTLDDMDRDNQSVLEREIARIKQVIFGDKEAEIPSLLSVLNSLKNRITRIEIMFIVLVILLIVGAIYLGSTRHRQDVIIDYLEHTLTPTPPFYPSGDLIQ